MGWKGEVRDDKAMSKRGDSKTLRKVRYGYWW
jgi:hypothetical protein